ncbi:MULTISPECIES: YwiB family protein [Virgibacillus]|uniref:DUF1934 domain-containing protein n=2 Tax=Virgibacillus TaxID=84406 RepID=A0ABQ2DDN0_9BACI|nr:MULTISPECIES: DUF1934 domain-containing protein [Virgibacillus]EQB38228.1 hypothetical protein M948_06530 [Virgibacillus sp. CM-4]MYL40935.1 DUF1934 family protein [Virgibacillus massiliensis]GGJ52947.1 hypothetical protein GCM10007111_13930 [Virgibacillus kapii]CDQ38267.1 putative beta-barrel protein YwiB [Virgibacillus massiliensis]
MNTPTTQVVIELSTIIDDNGQMEYNKIQETGFLYKKGNLDVLTFEEIADDQTMIKNLITIQSNRVNIKRSGNISMNQQFQEKQTTENVVKHPYGSIHMETFTQSISYHPLQKAKSGSLTIAYTVRLNGQEERHQKIDLMMKEDMS